MRTHTPLKRQAASNKERRRIDDDAIFHLSDLLLTTRLQYPMMRMAK